MTASVITLVKARETPDPYPGAYTLALGGTGEPRLTETEGRPARASAERKCAPASVAKVKAWIEANGTALTREVREGTGLGQGTVLAALRQLEAQGFLVSNEGQFKGWSLAN